MNLVINQAGRPDRCILYVLVEYRASVWYRLISMMDLMSFLVAN